MTLTLPILAFLALICTVDTCLRMKVTVKLSPCNRLQPADKDYCEGPGGFTTCYPADIKQSTATCNGEDFLFVRWPGNDGKDAYSIKCNEQTFDWEIEAEGGPYIQKTVFVACIKEF